MLPKAKIKFTRKWLISINLSNEDPSIPPTEEPDEAVNAKPIPVRGVNQHTCPQ